jgi:hypothetical protein
MLFSYLRCSCYVLTPFILFQFKRLFEFQLIGSISDECLKLACFCLPGCSCFIIEAECLLIDGDVYILALSRLQVNLLESLQLLVRAINRSLYIMDIELDGFCTGTFASVLYIHGKGDRVIQIHQILITAKIRDGKLSVAQSMSKGECWLDVFLISPTIAYVDAFLILLINDVALSLGSTFFAPGARIGV